MLGIKGMFVGQEYLAGDGIGYDKVRCLSKNPPDIPSGCYGVLIEYLDGELAENKDVWFENPEDGFSIYVEPA